MPFQRGNNLGKGQGRKGYEIEKKELKRMSSLFKRYLTLAEKIESGKASDNQKDAFERLKSLVLKIMDKLHANKEHLEHDFGDTPFQQIVIGKLVKTPELKELNGEPNKGS